MKHVSVERAEISRNKKLLEISFSKISPRNNLFAAEVVGWSCVCGGGEGG